MFARDTDSPHLTRRRYGGYSSPTSPQNQGHDRAWVVRRCVYVFIALAGFAALCVVIRFYMYRDRKRRRRGEPVVHGRNGRRWLKWHNQHESNADDGPVLAGKHAGDREAEAGEHGTADVPEKPRPSHAKPTREMHYEKDPNPNSLLNV
ncbi:hypothetical protein PFICI_12580 [Pestalotiopsis fici W106-1]|uniref:Uncharacterized protein n=1 Tax=Pestalotiopsis fici (strain W106-1 / CGMCC3.15140) TaxID=1229662 RepID=W3WS29_PESFW|nr:uncharacterized protein PFICI_12580 [Pestalotiopsis fici W106-1]ETS75636.1 hypothetical protein PFICI_12580 [Pestalotiopsis fici W106-1]